jgi:hypothetical protein
LRATWSGAARPKTPSNRPQPIPDPDCLFCKIIAGELPAQIVAEDERTIVWAVLSPLTFGNFPADRGRRSIVAQQ